MNTIRTRTDIALLLIRLLTGFVFLMHGYQKIFTYGPGAIGSGFVKMGIPMGTVMGPAIGLLELIGGIALILGIGTRIFAVLFVCDMLGAMTFVHGKNGFFLPTGFEFVLVLAGMALALAIGGGGPYAIDDRLHRTLPMP